MLSGMIQQPQNTNISKYLNLLIDDFYSEEESIWFYCELSSKLNFPLW